jgi:tRNA A37 methylthiotransferase MiaB
MSIEKINYYLNHYSQPIIVTGCVPDIDPDCLPQNGRVKIIKWRDDVYGFDRQFQAKTSLSSFDTIFLEDQVCPNIEKYKKENPTADVTFQDQFVKVVVSEGCIYNCSYCSERLAFPKFRSFDPFELVRRLKIITKTTKVFEAILIADSLGLYGKDIGWSLPDLIFLFKSEIPKLKLALNNLHPVNFLEYESEIINFIKDGTIIHLNLPIQSASDKILRKMNRLYNSDDIRRIFTTLRKMNFPNFDTHVIIGFPGEDEEDFKITTDFLIECGPRYVLCSAYLDCVNAPSYTLDNKVPHDIIEDRLMILERKLREVGIVCNSDQSDLSKERLRRLLID